MFAHQMRGSLWSLMAIAAIAVLVSGVQVSSAGNVVGRCVFYNQSYFDGNSAVLDISDDLAIATDKSALLPGGTAAFSNYTSYARGINGIMVDIAGLGGVPTAADFEFKVGNDSTPADWVVLGVSPTIAVRTGDGAGGSDRISIAFPAGSITGKWLEVTVKDTVATGLASDDVFYFGNAIGETGDSPTDAEVTPADEVAVRNNSHTLGLNPATITDACDFNRDRKVGPTDAILCRNNGTSSPTALQLISPPIPPTGAGLHVAQTGSDVTGDGSLANPWRTVRYGLTQLAAGDTLYIHAGIYPAGGDPDGTYEIHASGTAGNPITIRNYGTDYVRLRTVGTGVYMLDEDYITFEGLDIAPTGGTCVKGYGNYITVRNCILRGPNQAVKTNSLTTRYHHLLVENNHIYSFGDIPIFIDNMDSVIVRNNHIHDAWLLMDPGGVSDLIIEDNFMENTNHALGCLKIRWGNVEPQSGENCRGAIIRRNVMANGSKYVMLVASANGAMYYNNVFAKSDGGMTDQGLFYMQQDGSDAVDNKNENNVFKNNIFYVAGTDGSHPVYNALLMIADSMDEDYDDQEFDYNCWYKTAGTQYVRVGGVWTFKSELQGWRGLYDFNSISSYNPQMVNPIYQAGAAGFELTSSSPCIDSGTPLTHAVGSGSGTVITVADARYFSTGLDMVEGDTVWIGSPPQTATVIGKNIDTNTLTVDTSVSWSHGDPVTLPYEGHKPDIGAFEYDFGGGNTAPYVDAGPDRQTTLSNSANLLGTVSDDGPVTISWSKLQGLGSVTFGDPSSPTTTALFSESGTYILRLVADDSTFAIGDNVTVRVSATMGLYQMYDGMVVMEAEGYHGNAKRDDVSASPWLNETAFADYSGTGYLRAPVGSTEIWSDGAEAHYRIQFTDLATYYIWVRRYSVDATENSCLAGIDGTQFDQPRFDGYAGYWGQWAWRRGATVNIEAGNRRLSFVRQEINYKFDKIVITDDPTYTPSGHGPDADTANTAPQVDAGIDYIMNIASAGPLNGTVSDDGLPFNPGAVTTQWSKQSGPGAVTFDDASAVDTTATYSALGVYVLRLTADDGDVFDYDEVTITVAVTGGNLPPTVAAGSDNVLDLPALANLDGTVSDDGQPASPGYLTVSWSKQSGPGTVTFGDSSAVDTTASLSTDGVYVLRLTADDGEYSVYDEVTIAVYPGNSAPTVFAGGDDSCTLPDALALDGTVSDEGLPNPPSSVTTTWTKQSGPGTVTFGDDSAADTTAGFSTYGTYILRLTAHDGELSTYHEMLVTVNPDPSATGPFLESGGTLVMEAENCDTNDVRTDPSGVNWTLDNAPTGCVGAGYMYPGLMHPNYTSTWAEAAEMTYNIKIDTPGTYYIWIRRFCERSTGNSCYVGLDGAQLGGAKFDNHNVNFYSWQWKNLFSGTTATVVLSAGTHTFHVRRAEEAYRIDRILLTTNAGYTPSGHGPAESPRQE